MKQQTFAALASNSCCKFSGIDCKPSVKGKRLIADVMRRSYACYHSLVVVVTNHYRPQNDVEEELDARKLLTMSLARLAMEKECSRGMA